MRIALKMLKTAATVYQNFQSELSELKKANTVPKGIRERGKSITLSSA